MLFTNLKTATDSLVLHVDALDAKLQSVKAQLDALIASGGLSTQDQADLQAVIETITAEDAKVIADSQ